MSEARRVVFVLFPQCEILDIAGPMQAFHEANAVGARYELFQCASTPSVVTAQGLELAGLAPLPAVGPGDWVIVPGFPVLTTRFPTPVVKWVRSAFRAGALVMSVCTGTFILGRAGLLDGRQCTTHWKRIDELQRAFPRTRVIGDRLFVEDAGVISSAGIASGIDMALALIERDHGPIMASTVARELVVYVRRDGAHVQDSVYLDYQTHLHPGVHRVQQWIIAHPDSTAPLDELAQMAQMSPRHLMRVFKRATGLSLHDFRTRVRVEHAQTLLHNPRLTLSAIAEQCGFRDPRQLRRLWTQRFGAPPREFRTARRDTEHL